MADVINFKVFLTKETGDSSGKTEIRRFGIDSDVVTNYTYLREKLQTVFPDLRNRRFTIFWKGAFGNRLILRSRKEIPSVEPVWQPEERFINVYFSLLWFHVPVIFWHSYFRWLPRTFSILITEVRFINLCL